MAMETPFYPLSFGKSFMKIRSAVPENGCLIFMHYRNGRKKTRLHPFARSWLYNVTAVRGALWWFRQSHSVNYANHQRSPFARRRHDFRQAAARRFKLHFPRYRLTKVSWKSVQPFPRNGCLIFLTDGKKTKKNICKTHTHPRHLAAADA